MGEEPIEGDIFFNMWWRGISAELLAAMRDTPFYLDSGRRRVKIAGWQGSTNGFVGLHLEKLTENLSVPTGHVVMTNVKPYRVCEVMSARGYIPMKELPKVNFALQIIEDEASGLAHVALVSLANFNVEMPRLETEAGMSHSAMIVEPSWYFVFKHEPA